MTTLEAYELGKKHGIEAARDCFVNLEDQANAECEHPMNEECIHCIWQAASEYLMMDLCVGQTTIPESSEELRAEYDLGARAGIEEGIRSRLAQSVEV